MQRTKRGWVFREPLNVTVEQDKVESGGQMLGSREGRIFTSEVTLAPSSRAACHKDWFKSLGRNLREGD